MGSPMAIYLLYLPPHEFIYQRESLNLLFLENSITIQ